MNGCAANAGVVASLKLVTPAQVLFGTDVRAVERENALRLLPRFR